MIRALLAATLFTAPGVVAAEVLEVRSVTEGVWAIVGEMAQRSPENLANNATFGVVVTKAGTVLIDPGGSWKGGEALHDIIRGVTVQPVAHVINTGGQDHRWLGNSYWQAQGATVIASAAATMDQKARASMQMTVLSQLIGDAFEGTEPGFAQVTLLDRFELA